VQTHILNNRSQDNASRSSSETGFTLLETVIAMLVLTIGLLGVAAAVSYAMAASNMSRNVTDSKQTIVSTLEQMENLRNTRQLTFGQIANVGAVDDTGGSKSFAGFPTGFQKIYSNPGPDGIYGTADDKDDTSASNKEKDGYEREIVITELTPYLKKVKVTVHYPGRAGNTLELVGYSYLNNDARGTFRR
jgi:type II secretory pathway pseudopilin PulG